MQNTKLGLTPSNLNTKLNTMTYLPNKLENVIHQIDGMEIKIGDHVRSDEMTTFQKVLALRQHTEMSHVLIVELVTDPAWKASFAQIQVGKSEYVEFRKTL